MLFFILRTKPYFISVLFVLLFGAGCMSPLGLDSGDEDDSATTTTTHQYLFIPNASWYSGSSTYTASPASTAPTATVSEGSPILTVGDSVTWQVNFEAIVEVEVDVSFIIITSEEFDGYFTYPITEEDILNGYVEVEMELAESPPSTTVCNRDYNGNGTCYEEVDSGVTGADFSVANEIGGEMTLTAAFEVELTVSETIEVSEEDADDGSGDNGGSSGDSYCSDWVAYCSCNLRACSDGTNAWYDVGSGVYYCASTSDCTAAATSAVQWCTSGC